MTGLRAHLVVALLAVLLAGCSTSTDELAVLDAAIGASANGVTAGVYARIENRGPADALTGLASPAAERASLHVMEASGGMTTMKPTPSFEIPAGATVELRPGARHGMLEGLTRTLRVGDSVSVTFVFASGRELTVRAPVRSLLDLRGR